MKMYPLRLDDDFHALLKETARVQGISIHTMITEVMRNHCVSYLTEAQRRCLAAGFPPPRLPLGPPQLGAFTP